MVREWAVELLPWNRNGDRRGPYSPESGPNTSSSWMDILASKRNENSIVLRCTQVPKKVSRSGTPLSDSSKRKDGLLLKGPRCGWRAEVVG